MNALLLVFAVATCLLVVQMNCFSIPNCSAECNRDNCPEIPNCECGTHLDYCECCTFCLGCPGKECNLVAMEKCANGTICKPLPGATGLQKINGPGMCI